MESGGINSTVVTWTPPPRGVITCSGGVTYIVNVSTTSDGPIVQRSVTGTNATVDVELNAVTEVSVVVVSAIGNSEPGVWTSETTTATSETTMTTPGTNMTTPGTTTTTPGTSGECVYVVCTHTCSCII